MTTASRRVVLPLVVATLAVGGCKVSADGGNTPVAAAGTEASAPADAAQRATGLGVRVGCDEENPRTPVATFTWTPAATPGQEQRIEVSLFRADLERGGGEMLGPFPPDQTSVTWKGVHGQANHFWRVLTRHDEAWMPSETGLFAGPLCIADFAAPPGTSLPPRDKRWR